MKEYLTFSQYSNTPIIRDEKKARWRFTITPFIWLPSVSGSMKLDQSPGALGFSFTF